MWENPWKRRSEIAMREPAQALGVLMLDLEGTTLSASEYELLQRPTVGGLILFSRNYSGPTQLQELIAAVRACNSDLLIAVDQEGGRVQRFRDGFLELPALHKIGARYADDPAQARELARQCAWAMAAEVLHCGIDISFAPVLDLYSADSPVIKERAFSDDVSQVTELASSYIKGMNEAGMAATGKHYPGHGFVAVDSHKELPVDERSAEEILSRDYQVFANCIKLVAAIMPAHVRYPAVDSLSAGFSKRWIQHYLRDRLQFDGVIFSDDLSMAAARDAGTAPQRAEMALAAGCDMLLVCNDRQSALSVADWLEQNEVPPSERIANMRASPAAAIADLYNEDRWKIASAAARSLTVST
tara:strand:+ start:21052 stop:22125 length:1074 start_codon:yes stop_codon:yes gene_type:complete